MVRFVNSPFTLPYTFNEAYALAVDSTDSSAWELIAVVPVEPTCSCCLYCHFWG